MNDPQLSRQGNNNNHHHHHPVIVIDDDDSERCIPAQTPTPMSIQSMSANAEEGYGGGAMQVDSGARQQQQQHSSTNNIDSSSSSSGGSGNSGSNKRAREEEEASGPSSDEEATRKRRRSATGRGGWKKAEVDLLVQLVESNKQHGRIEWTPVVARIGRTKDACANKYKRVLLQRQIKEAKAEQTQSSISTTETTETATTASTTTMPSVSSSSTSTSAPASERTARKATAAVAGTSCTGSPTAATNLSVELDLKNFPETNLLAMALGSDRSRTNVPKIRRDMVTVTSKDSFHDFVRAVMHGIYPEYSPAEHTAMLRYKNGEELVFCSSEVQFDVFKKLLSSDILQGQTLRLSPSKTVIH